MIFESSQPSKCHKRIFNCRIFYLIGIWSVEVRVCTSRNSFESRWSGYHLCKCIRSIATNTCLHQLLSVRGKFSVFCSRKCLYSLMSIAFHNQDMFSYNSFYSRVVDHFQPFQPRRHNQSKVGLVMSAIKFRGFPYFTTVAHACIVLCFPFCSEVCCVLGFLPWLLAYVLRVILEVFTKINT